MTDLTDIDSIKLDRTPMISDSERSAIVSVRQQKEFDYETAQKQYFHKLKEAREWMIDQGIKFVAEGGGKYDRRKL